MDAPVGPFGTKVGVFLPEFGKLRWDFCSIFVIMISNSDLLCICVFRLSCKFVLVWCLISLHAEACKSNAKLYVMNEIWTVACR